MRTRPNYRRVLGAATAAVIGLSAASQALAFDKPGDGGHCVQPGFAVVPEPSAIALMTVGIGGVLFALRRKRSSQQ